MNVQKHEKPSRAIMRNIKYLVIVLSLLLRLTNSSITGITYMDDSDFRQKYRNVYECDPLYWHPLHLPDHCLEMFENLIRSGPTPPYTIVKERGASVSNFYTHNNYYYNSGISSTSGLLYALNDELFTFEKPKKSYSPFDKLFKQLRSDIEQLPSGPKISFIPNLGPAALYRQPISYKSENMIKKLAKLYANSAQ
ncbi:uncharacterized protein LOC126979092 [Leptidea sinapis]|uniref:uncharacterized protein LOC126979092 n=1 Tax=Leptidea sinapis TaxID=189913 RepID=UPI00212C0914|nr:uncharacterized protein LOC126979092 [Leptidea sinapis]